MSAMATLIQYKNNIAGVKIALDHSPFRIGRSEENDLCINDELASRNHVLIEKVRGGEEEGRNHYILRDLDSTNGTFVNHTPVSAHLLVDDDMIRIGQTFFRFSEGTQAEMGETKILKKSFIPGVFYTTDKPK
jgi:pSer/pThr/pTyr-binding forkhead associated (FHA) protein